ncbi:hypothetical protein MKK68_27850 [Methylobacterium sp. E-016]|uniref:hypothetical protein n=1 Tax=Methylobacterium sp. E-016 TaxID=2836556 RepID=UPI001FB97F02|nr:hypothetical protein [Methylobacterium sp. E-016]MCJ2079398.1 hypothetical protein [Methylobacterium sp. E-016]
MPPRWPEVPCLAAYPFIVIRVACTLCPHRSGSYRLARLAAKFGPETPLADVLERIALDCPWRERPGARRGNQYVPRCQAHFPDLDRAGPPDLPPGMGGLRLIRGGKR